MQYRASSRPRAALLRLRRWSIWASLKTLCGKSLKPSNGIEVGRQQTGQKTSRMSHGPGHIFVSRHFKQNVWPQLSMALGPFKLRLQQQSGQMRYSSVILSGWFMVAYKQKSHCLTSAMSDRPKSSTKHQMFFYCYKTVVITLLSKMKTK